MRTITEQELATRLLKLIQQKSTRVIGSYNGITIKSGNSTIANIRYARGVVASERSLISR